MATVRIADDLNAALKKFARDDEKARSVTQIVDDTLRQMLLDGGKKRTPSGTPAGTKTVPKPPKPQVKTGVKRDKTADSGPCVVHPPGRVIDGVCMACGRPAK